MADAEPPSPLKGEIEDRAQAPDLCTQCGICCTGAIHVRAILEENEMEPARQAGLPTLEDSDRPAFSLPCPKLLGTCCTIYGHRPRVCMKYLCALLCEYEAGSIDYDGARAKVMNAKALIASLREVMPPGMTLPDARLRRLVNPQADADSLAGTALELRLRATALELYLDKHFRLEKEGRLLDAIEMDKQ